MPQANFPEDAPHHLGLVRIDGAFAAHRLAFAVEAPHDVIAVADPAAGFSLLDPTPKAAMGLLGQVLQEQSVHRALQADVQFRDLALGEGHDRDARELHVFEQGGDVRLVA